MGNIQQTKLQLTLEVHFLHSWKYYQQKLSLVHSFM